MPASGLLICSLGAAQVLSDAIHSRVLATRKLTTVFRQAAASSIISSAYAVNQGDFPMVRKPERLRACDIEVLTLHVCGDPIVCAGSANACG